ncbi:MAG: radical SAM protein [Sandaracinaceae bacterium]
MAFVSLESVLRRGRDALARGPLGGRHRTPIVHPKPTRVFWWWEQICNLSCNHCDIGRRTLSYRLKPALDLEQKRRVIDRLADWLGPGFSLSLFAGEPFLHQDIFDVLAHAHARGAVTSVTTNATLLGTKKQAGRVVESGLDFMAVSLDADDAEIHDRSRGKPGAFVQAMRGLDAVLEAREAAGAKKPVVWVNSIVMKDNLASLLALSDRVKERGIEGHTFQPIASTTFFQGIKDDGARWFERSPLWPDTAEVIAFVDELERRASDGYPIQSSARDFAKWRAYFRDPIAFSHAESCENELSSMLVTHDGHVKMCPNVREAFGHILDDDLGAMWGSPASERARAHVTECDSQCKILANNKEDFFF